VNSEPCQAVCCNYIHGCSLPPDDDNRIELEPIATYNDCQQPFINACYVDVRDPYVCVCAHVCVYVCAHVCVCIHMCLCVHMCVCVCTCVCLYTRACVHVYVCVCCIELVCLRSTR